MGKKFAIAGVIVLFAVVGVWNIRQLLPGNSESGEVAKRRLDSLPKTIGPWIGSDVPVNERHMKAADFEAYLARRYRHEKTGAEVSVMFIYGKPGDLGAHDPELCYGGTGYREVGHRQKRTIPTGEFWSARFDNPEIQPPSIEVCWGWGIDGNWQAPDDPRHALADQRRMYKVYVQQARRETTGPTALDEFLPDFCRELKKVLE